MPENRDTAWLPQSRCEKCRLTGGSMPQKSGMIQRGGTCAPEKKRARWGGGPLLLKPLLAKKGRYFKASNKDANG